MTGFGRGDFRNETMDISVEIKTVNHRYRDFFLKIPRVLNPLEENIRKMISDVVTRGRIEVFIRFKRLGAENKSIVYNENLALSYLEVLKKIQGLDPILEEKINIDLVARFPDIIDVEEVSQDAEYYWQWLEPVLKVALCEVEESRKREGDHLQNDMAMRCDLIADMKEGIKVLAPEMLLNYQAKIRDRVEKYTQSLELDEQRILTEVAVMSDKLAIDEEIIRLESHIKRFKEMLVINDEPVGRKLDFLVQELNREINTIGSKSNDVAIANLVVDVKSEIEKIREQIQNIE